MAATAAAARLSEAHRLSQARLGASTVRGMVQLWPLLDATNLDGSFERWLLAALSVIRSQRAQSARLAANYLTTFKALELGAAALPLALELAEAAPIEAVTTSMLVTGPVAVKTALRSGATTKAAMDIARTRSAASAMRHVLNGGRETVTASVRADGQAQGWARTTSGKPCAFCAMLASRGGVYSSRSVHFECHDHCSCGVEPIFRDDAKVPPSAQRWADLWRQARDADSDTLTEFTRLVAAV